MHDPSAIALVSLTNSSVKKSIQEDPPRTTYCLYEATSDNFRLIRGKEGNEIFLSGIFSLYRINYSWHLFGGENMDITISTDEMVVDYTYEIKTDSIFMSDTIPQNVAGKEVRSDEKLFDQVRAWPEVAEGLGLPTFEGLFDRSETGRGVNRA